MVQQMYHSEDERQAQLSPFFGDLWETEIVPRLPAQLDEMAWAYQALQRTREIDRASDLLRGLLARVLGRLSYRGLGCWATVMGVAEISEGGWRKWVRKSAEWLQWVLGERTASSRSAVARTDQPHLMLVDGTSLRADGGSGDDRRVQLVYDLSEGRLTHVLIGDNHQPETLVGVPGQAGTLYLGDRKYGTRANLLSRAACQQEMLCRYSPQLCRLEGESGEKIEVVQWLQAYGAEQELVATRGFASQGDQRVPVRLLACRLPEEVAARIREKILAKAKRRGQTVRPQTLYLAGWVLLVTTLDQSGWPARELFWLYRHRWQVELLIKRLKQFLLLVQLRNKRAEEVRATILAALVAWMLIEEEGQQLIRALEWGEETGEPGLVQAYLPLLEHWEQGQDVDTWTANMPMPTISVWTLLASCVTRWRSLVLGSWSLPRVLACLPRLTRYFCPSPRRRLNQRLVFQAWGYQRLLAGAFSRTFL